MQMARTHLASSDAERRTPQRSGANPGAAAERLVGAEAVQPAIAVCRQGAAGELALVNEAEPNPQVAFDAEALAEEFRDFDLELATVVRLALKRALDILVAAAALLVGLPLFVVIGALIKLGDSGPVFFSQRRVGLHGQTFRMLKFRSMVTEAERLRPRLEVRNESNGPAFKMKLDPRVTVIGRFIRKYSLDELPQLINVLRGEMSIVGPRPSLPSEVASYEPWQYRRFAVRPGLTCHWQVCARRYQVSFDDWMRLDLKYVEEWSLRRDLDLIFRTFRVVLGGTGE
jgi:lipopolysaccharide/colanic/teichoic acid biosynthesis glycosyltransferase